MDLLRGRGTRRREEQEAIMLWLLLSTLLEKDESFGVDVCWYL